MKTTSNVLKHSNRFDWWAGLLLFLSFIAAYKFIGINAAMKVMGFSCMLVGAVWYLRRSVPVGVEGKPPITEISGNSAKLIGVVFIVMGGLMCLYSIQAACVLGWGEDSECSKAKW